MGLSLKNNQTKLFPGFTYPKQVWDYVKQEFLFFYFFMSKTNQNEHTLIRSNA